MLRVCWSIALFVLLASLSQTVYAAKLMELIDLPVPANLDGSQPSLSEVTEAIMRGCRDRGWTARRNEDGSITASILVRGKHFAEIDIAYDTAQYSITYRSSRNLDYNAKRQRIHRNYNRWVTMLSNSINRRFGVRSQNY